MSHSLTADLGVGDLDSAAVADDALVTDGLELSAVALPFLRGSEDLLAEETFPLGSEGSVVDGFGLLNLTV